MVHSEPLFPEAAEPKRGIVPEFSLEDFENESGLNAHGHVLEGDDVSQRLDGKGKCNIGTRD